MATPFRLEHDFPEISLTKFEKYLNHPDLNRALAGMPSFRSRDLLEEQQLASGDVLWKFKVVAGGELPPAIAKLVSPDMMTWIETSHFKKDEHCIEFHIEPIKGKDKFEGGGTWRMIKDGKGTKRIIEGTFNVKVPFVGKVFESFLVAELKKNYEIEPELQRQFYQSMK